MLYELSPTCLSLSVRLHRLSRYFFAIWHRNLCTILKRWSLRAIRPKCNVMHSEGLTKQYWTSGMELLHAPKCKKMNQVLFEAKI